MACCPWRKRALASAGAPVDAFGVGTQLGVSADAPYVDSIYKLVEYDGTPTMKLSSGKVSAPGRKQVWRPAEGDHADVLGLRDEPMPDGMRPLLEPVMRGGRRLAPNPPLEELRRTFERDLASVPAKARRLQHAEHLEVGRSQALEELTARAHADALDRAGLDDEPEPSGG